MSGPEVEETVAYLGSKKRRGKLPTDSAREAPLFENTQTQHAVADGKKRYRSICSQMENTENASEKILRHHDMMTS